MLSFTPDDGRAYSVRAFIISRRTFGGSLDRALFELPNSALIIGNSGVATLINSPIAMSGDFIDAGADWSVSMVASGSNILTRVTGDSGFTIHWCIDFEFVET